MGARINQLMEEWGPTPMMHVGLDPKTNAVRDGLASQHRACEVVHPVQGLQQNFLRIKMDRKAAEMGQLYGSHMMMHVKWRRQFYRGTNASQGSSHIWLG